MSQRIVIVGAGNLATRLSVALKERGYNIVQVYSRTASSAKELAELLQTGFTINPGDIISDADIYFVALKDSALEKVLPDIYFADNLVVHCSGSLPMSALKSYSRQFGVLYPLQTFSKFRDVDFSQIPVFIEGCSAEVESNLMQIADSLSDNTRVLESARRQYLHVAAVFACNFVNHFYAVSSEILKTQHIGFDVLQPLIEETASKVMDMMPDEAQTGPAVRYDTNIIDKHLDLLENMPHEQELYKMVSESIYQFHNKSEI